ncbi:flagellar biosynthesis protein FliR [Salipiger aestuarii]|uniref:Flagellar biosynthetic protein FliR n=1 Tax=Salipiger aestuarii TaxID=568098 RepID=A0A327YMF0_9RHOB|nr:flagellar biosynthetic protein FliR [Salipiger aestuarii]EIE52598.1 flagellar biosynthetic protein FliR [Citreicella sp. 357]KAA8609835.1 flagellar biosynthesis protein FliR [Salipiger aestuarii]KAA8616147.1 flagellar biosynthesis protein FliR [Salipiger aestuarii]KAB2543095.1 flagellar biosynthesis protein FliR [Salipiger aestuarii]RAK21406.1 flagellar biosynthetic protein FliR [Salipiger aestuarii]
MTLPSEVVTLISGWAWLGSIVFLRVAAMIASLPGLGEQSVSVRVRLVLSLLMTTIVLPVAAQKIPAIEPSYANVLKVILTESISGLILGLWLRLLMHALQTAGSIAAQSTSLAQLLGNSAADPMPAIGHILTVSALALLMITGFHVKAASFLILSYDLLPPLSFPDPGLIGQTGRRQITESFSLAFTLAAPFVILSALYNLTLGFINKAMPQLMVAFVGAPVITLGAMAMLILTAPVMLSVWLSTVDLFLSNPFR